ncbi:MAG TPA: GAF domain-containing protein [Ktedonobacterales bacterium]|nr:GAF domain-containing protein [Ktedonobacterales bacterium]
MSDNTPIPEASASRPRNNAVTAAAVAVLDDWAPDAGTTPPTPFAVSVDQALRLATEVARNLIGAHQAAAALIVSDDWKHARKWFSLSSKYTGWFAYRAPAAGFGIHALVVTEGKPMRLTQAELETHPAWQGFGSEAGKHPPMRGWLAVPLIGHNQRHYGLLQLSDKYNDADFTEDDEIHFSQLAQLTAIALDALCELHGEQRIGLQH